MEKVGPGPISEPRAALLAAKQIASDPNIRANLVA
jgi:hypothetical protein